MTQERSRRRIFEIDRKTDPTIKRLREHRQHQAEKAHQRRRPAPRARRGRGRGPAPISSTSTIGTIALGENGRPVTEDEPFNWADKGGGYIRSRVEAEQLVFQYVRERGLPAVALCVSNTYGPGDFQPTPHG